MQTCTASPTCGMTKIIDVCHATPPAPASAATATRRVAASLPQREWQWPSFSCSVPGGRVWLVANALTGDDALDETELEPFGTFNDKWTIDHFGERPSQEMLAGHRHRDDFQRALHSSGDARRAGDVVNQDQPAVGLQHPC